MNQSMLVTVGLGFVLGLKHATEADHLVAVSTIVSERRSIWQAAGAGALWGIGHTASLLVAGLFVIALGVAIPPRLANLLELAVAFMIIFLGTRLLYLILRARSDLHVHPHVHEHERRRGWRPLMVGIVHGLAGSAALTLLVLSEVVRNGSTALGFVYLLVFGLGSIAGMLLMSGLIGVPISLGIRFFQRTLLPLRLFAGIFSTSFGVFYAFKVVEKLASY
jgi:high-affinity nickel permease